MEAICRGFANADFGLSKKNSTNGLEEMEMSKGKVVQSTTSSLLLTNSTDKSQLKKYFLIYCLLRNKDKLEK